MDISVITPAHNAARYIADGLLSIVEAAPPGRSIEVIVIDDASTDDTAQRVRAFAQHSLIPIRLVSHRENRGAGLARTTGMQHASGRLIAFADADDLVLPGRFADQAALFDANTRLILCGGDIIEFDDATNRPGRALTFPTRQSDIRADMLFYCSMWAGTTMFKRELLEHVSYPSSRIGEDWLFAFEAAEHGEVANTGKPAIYYRQHARQVTAKAAGDLGQVLWIWDHMLRRVGLCPTHHELMLHAVCSPYVRTESCHVPQLKQATTAAEWLLWSRKLSAAAVEYSAAVSDRCGRVLQTINACRYAGAQVVRLF